MNPWLKKKQPATLRVWRTRDQRDLPIIEWNDGQPNLREILGDQSSARAWLPQDCAMDGPFGIYWGEVAVTRGDDDQVVPAHLYKGDGTVWAYITRCSASVLQLPRRNVAHWKVD
jgi:hypothetical protein